MFYSVNSQTESHSLTQPMLNFEADTHLDAIGPNPW
jgi:hypothetical protein